MMRTRAETKRPLPSPEIRRKTTRQSLKIKKSSCKETLTDSRLKTPKSDRRRSETVTPVRDDFVCSQHFDSQVVVGWDCNSPDTLRGVRKSDDENGVSDLVMKLITNEPNDDDTVSRSTPPLLKLWRDTNVEEDQLLDNIPNKLKKKGRIRRKSAKDSALSQELLNKLKLALNECTDANNSTDERPREADVFISDDDDSDTKDGQNTSDDLFESTKVTTTGPTPLKGKLRVSPRLSENKKTEKNTFEMSANMLDKRRISLDNDVTWSDDELFDEDSFIIKATQCPEDTKKFNSPIFGMKRKTSSDGILPKSKCTRYTFQLDDNKSSDTNVPSQQTNKLSAFTNISSRSSENCKKVNPSNSSLASTSQTFNSIKTVNNTLSGIGTSLGTKPPLNQTSNSNASNKFQSKSNTRTCLSWGEKSSTSNSSTNQINNKAVPSHSDKTSDINQIAIDQKQFYPGANSLHNGRHGGKLKSVSDSSTISENRTKSCSTGAYLQSNVQANLNRSFKKHNSFSGPESTVSSKPATLTRQRSMSGNTANKITGSSNIGVATVMRSGIASGQNKGPYLSSVNASGQNKGPHLTSSSGLQALSNIQRQPVTQNQRQPVTQNQRQPVTQNQRHCATQNGIKNSTSNISTLPTPTCTTTRPNIKSSYPTSNTASRPYTMQVNKNNQSTKNSSTPKTSLNNNVKSTGEFDKSLTDDLLCQLAEPDDLLDSQACDDNTFANVTITRVESAKKTIPNQNHRQSLNTCDKPRVNTDNKKHMPETDTKSVKYKFRSSQRLVAKTGGVKSEATRSVVDSTKPYVNKVTKPVANNANVFTKPEPVKDTKKSMKESAVLDDFNAYSEDLFPSDDEMLMDDEAGILADDDAALLADDDAALLAAADDAILLQDDDDAAAALLMDDDDLCDDDGLTEPQILAMLDEAELLATQQYKSSPKQNSKAQQPVNKNKQTECQGQNSGQGHSSSQGLSSSQGRPSSQGHSSSQGHNSSQGQLSNSQTKYCASEIERKKREALKRRQTRLKNTQTNIGKK